MRLYGLHYVIEHIAGEDNVWPDIVSRWHTREVIRVAAGRTRSRHAAPLAPISHLRPHSDAGFVFPTLEEIREVQQAAELFSPARRSSAEEDGVTTIEGRPWIPNGGKELLARLFVVAHTGAQGHRGQDPMNTVLQERFWIGPRIIPRPYGPTFAAEKRNEALHWDFIYLGSGYGDNANLLVAKDELTHYCELIPCATPTAFGAAEGLSM
ncbi:LOW QUALITY PROTEIN: hypothetical protein PHMEG_00020356 [Phytophthora megakarya]|uniref:Uncharacterized protein n=1 Tax=Phytophthora megakarya TaxID=4795 RepID=A0A225VPA7_9STRA|nr:LOW QUALITY PROTEIN: hypothetical protein PHMEG_00020356 [Phytophthora megakarya]